MRPALNRLSERIAQGMGCGFEQLSVVLTKLGAPQKNYPAVHLAGTNGKGSTAVMIAEGLRAAGRRVGLYTSPHLQRVNERFVVNGVAIDDAALDALLDRVLAMPEQLSFFEVLTAVAALHFAQSKVDVAVVETGLGGRLDATRVFEPQLSVITPVGLDHQEILGDTLEQIATEKAGTFVSGVSVVCAPQAPPVADVLQDHAARVGCRLTWSEPGELEPRHLPGAHQRVNAATALTALAELLTVNQSVIAAATEARWPGRLERIGQTWLDCAHNTAAAQAVSETLAEHRPVDVIFGALADKNARGMIAALDPIVARWILVSVDNPRSWRPVEALEAAWPELGGHPVDVATSLVDALKISREPRLITGSAYLVGEALSLLEAREMPDRLADPAHLSG